MLWGVQRGTLWNLRRGGLGGGEVAQVPRDVEDVLRSTV